IVLCSKPARLKIYRFRLCVYIYIPEYKFCVRHDIVVVDKNKPLPFTGLQDTCSSIIYCDDLCAFKKRSDKKVTELQDSRRQKTEKV
ncbi:hypothetical protein TSAR_006429, partial [Trichomalopsis sarcophagae]